jgi:hypothetical protein
VKEINARQAIGLLNELRNIAEVNGDWREEGNWLFNWLVEHLKEVAEGEPICTGPKFGKQMMLYLGGSKTSYRCPDCGANVFTKIEEGRFICNGCQARWRGE